MQFLLWMKELPWIVTVRESSWVYPIVETTHGIGMGLLVGTLTVIDLRLLGLLRRVPVSALASLTPLLWGGFVLNACSGALMFMSDGPRLVDNWIFQVKMLLIASGVLLAWRLQRRAARQSTQGSEGGPELRLTRYLAVASLFAWYGAILAGRVSAFLGDQ